MSVNRQASTVPPEVVSGWITEVQGERLAAERELAGTTPKGTFKRDEVAELIEALGDNLRKLTMLADADPAAKAALYKGLGLRLTYHPERKIVSAEVDLSCARVRVGGGTRRVSYRCPVAHRTVGVTGRGTVVTSNRVENSALGSRGLSRSPVRQVGLLSESCATDNYIS